MIGGTLCTDKLATTLAKTQYRHRNSFGHSRIWIPNTINDHGNMILVIVVNGSPTLWVDGGSYV